MYGRTCEGLSTHSNSFLRIYQMIMPLACACDPGKGSFSEQCSEVKTQAKQAVIAEKTAWQNLQKRQVQFAPSSPCRPAALGDQVFSCKRMTICWAGDHEFSRCHCAFR